MGPALDELRHLDDREHVVDPLLDVGFRNAFLLEPNATLSSTVMCGKSA